MSTNRSLIRSAELVQVEDGQFGHTSSGQRCWVVHREEKILAN